MESLATSPLHLGKSLPLQFLRRRFLAAVASLQRNDPKAGSVPISDFNEVSGRLRFEELLQQLATCFGHSGTPAHVVITPTL